MNFHRHGELVPALLFVLLGSACSSESQTEAASDSVEANASESQGNAVDSPSKVTSGSSGNEACGLAPSPDPPSGANASPLGPVGASGPVSSTPQGSSAHGGASNGGAGNGGTAQGDNLGGTAASGPNPSTNLGVHVDGPDLVVSGKPFHIRGVGWNPVPSGKRIPLASTLRGPHR